MGVELLLLSEANRLARQVDRLQTRIDELLVSNNELRTRNHALDDESRVYRKPRIGVTPMQLKILTRIAQGYSNAQIAELHSLAERTVRQHVCGILLRLRLRNRTEAALYAWRNGVISIDEAWATVETYQWGHRMVSQCVLAENEEA